MRKQLLINGGAARLAKKVFITSTLSLGVAALAVAMAAAPADAQARRKGAAEAAQAIPDIANGQPMTLVVSLNQQKIDIYRGTTHITSAGVSTGMRGYATKAGVFSILEKKRHHRSNLYSGAPMPWMQRLTWSGTALHAGVLPGYPASHGCIRLPFSFAPKLFGITTVGEHVVVARDRVAPVLIAHDNLFQPIPSPEPPITARDEPLQRQSSNEVAPGLPVVLAKAEVGTAATYTAPPDTLQPEHVNRPKLSVGEPVDSLHAIASRYSVNVNEDTRTHAIDPSGLATGAVQAHAIDSTPSATPTDKAPIEVAALRGSPAVLVEAVAQDGASPAPAAAIAALATVPAAKPAPPAPAVQLSAIARKLGAGTKAAGIEAAEPRSSAPLRILVTRRTQRDRIVGVQRALADMGFLEAQNFDGTLGRATTIAIRAFQKEHGLSETGAFTEDLVTLVYHIARKQEPPVGHLFVRQEFGRVFDTPVSFRDPDKPLGTHLFTAMKFGPEDTETKWMAISLQGDDSAAVLDRLEIPDDVRRKISERLTPGSSLIVGDVAINSATLPKGADFLVWTKEGSGSVQRASIGSDASSSRPRKKRVQPSTRRQGIFGFRRYPRNYQGWPW